MKGVIGCILAAVAAVAFMGLQIGLFGPRAAREESAVEEKIVVKKTAPVRAKFPEDLAPAARAKPVAAAAPFKVANTPHKLVFVKVNGSLHDWHGRTIDDQEEWAATNVEEAELVIVVSGQTKTMIERATFANGPPVERFRWELEASVVEAKTGQVLAHRSFVNMPRTIQPREPYELTALGSPVKYPTVFNWVANQSKTGFSASVNATPLVTVLEKQ